MKKLWKWIDYNQGRFVGLVLSIAILIWTFGCPSMVTSLISPTQKITRAELTTELETSVANLELQVNALYKQADVKFQELDRQDALKKRLAEFGLVALQTGQINPAGIGVLIAGLLGIGAMVDNRAKDKIIKVNNKNNKVKDG